MPATGRLLLTSPGDPEKEKGDKRFPKGSGNSKVDELHNLNDRKYRDKHHQWNHDRDEAEPDQPPAHRVKPRLVRCRCRNPRFIPRPLQSGCDVIMWFTGNSFSGGSLSTLVMLVMVFDPFVSGTSIMHSDVSGQAAMMRRPSSDVV